MCVCVHFQFKITDKVLLAKSSIVLAVVILSFFLLHTIPNVHIDLGKSCNVCTCVLYQLYNYTRIHTHAYASA